MNRLATSSQKVVSHTPPFGTPLSKQQWAAVKQFKPLVEEWNSFPEVTASDMGRAASKVESVEEVLRCLESEVVALPETFAVTEGRTVQGLRRLLILHNLLAEWLVKSTEMWHMLQKQSSLIG